MDIGRQTVHAPVAVYRRLAVGGFVSLMLAACGGGGAGDDPRETTGQLGVDEAQAALQPDGPLRGLGLTERMPEGATPVVPRLAFTTRNTEVTAVVRLGRDVPEGATLTVAWYRLTGPNEREHLFSHDIAVGPGGRGLSQGVSEPGIAPGLYETVATLDQWNVRTPWVVRIAGPSAAASALVEAPDSMLASARSFAQVGDESWNVPEAGESSWWEEPASGDLPDLPPPANLDACTVNDVSGGLDPFTELTAQAVWIGRCPERTLTATVSGAPQTLATAEPTEGPSSLMYGQGDVCELPGGSDLPGTVVRLTALGGTEGPYSTDFTLPDLGEALVAGLETSPDPGGGVEAGDRIDVHALAMVMPPALGIERLSVYAGDELVDSVGNGSGSSEPRPCDLGRLVARIVTAYDVPADPPPVVRICVEAVGFDGTKNRDCADFYTSEVWEGSYRGTVTDPNCGGRTGRWSLAGTFRITVDGRDAATLEGQHTVTGSCAGPTVGTATVPLTIVGKRTRSGIELPTFFGGAETIVLAVAGNRATGTFTGQAYTTDTGATVDVTFEATCATCAAR
jgi:hypothetical protein